jgi:hypothetical protein
MESLGFSNPESIWTDSPNADPAISLIAASEADIVANQTMADWAPTEVTERLGGRSFRWGVLLFSVAVIAALAGAAWWIYQRPATEAAAATAAVIDDAENLQSSLTGLEEFNAGLEVAGEDADTAGLFVADAAARQLFADSGALPATESATRSAAAAASSATLDGVRLASDAHAYLNAVGPILVAPDLETDPNLVELDEAARSFGDWQLRFDQVRTALPDGVLPGITEQLDVLSGDLSAILTAYVDALRTDDGGAVTEVLAGLSGRLQDVAGELETELVATKAEVTDRIAEARAALTNRCPKTDTVEIGFLRPPSRRLTPARPSPSRSRPRPGTPCTPRRI